MLSMGSTRRYFGCMALTLALSCIAQMAEAGTCRWTRAKASVGWLHDSANAIEKRLDALECHGPSHQLSIHLLHQVCELKEAISCDADWNRIDRQLHDVKVINDQLLQVIAARCSLHEDRRLRVEVERFQDRFYGLERELRKCLASLPNCGPNLPAHAGPWDSNPSYYYESQRPRIEVRSPTLPIPQFRPPVMPPIPVPVSPWSDPRLGPSIQVNAPSVGREILREVLVRALSR